MRWGKLGLQATVLLAGVCALGQGTFIYDQQSSTDEFVPPFGAGTIIQQFSSYGQSFTPALTSVGFIRLKLYDGSLTDGLGATFYVNLRSNSISGPVLGFSTGVLMTNGFAGPVNFYFTP